MELKRFAMGKFLLVNVFMWAAHVSAFCFTTVFLMDKGLTEKEIGYIVAVGNVLAIAMQPFFTSLESRGKLSLSRLVILLGSIILLMYFSSIFINVSLLAGIVFTILVAVEQDLPGYANSLGFYFRNRGHKINYGIARGTGSIVYSATSAILGFVVARLGTIAVPVSGACMIFFMILTVVFMPTEPVKKEETKSGGYLEFLKSNKVYAVLIFGISLTIAMHQISNQYAIQIAERAGGDSSVMGLMVAAAAIAEVPVMYIYDLLEKKIQTRFLMAAAAVGLTLKAALICCSATIPMLYVSYATQCLGYALLQPAGVSLANKFFDEKDRVTAQALMYAVNPIGGVIGSILGGQILTSSGTYPMLIAGTAVSLAGTVIMILSALHFKDVHVSTSPQPGKKH